MSGLPGIFRRDGPFLAVAGGVVALDQITKALVERLMDLGQSVPVEGLLRLTYVTNSGSAFGFFQGQTLFLIMASILGIGAVVLYYHSLAAHPLLRWGLGLILGGAAGNLIDRVLRGAVVDFVDAELWPGYHFPAFNLADASINVGLLLLALHLFRSRSGVRA